MTTIPTGNTGAASKNNALAQVTQRPDAELIKGGVNTQMEIFDLHASALRAKGLSNEDLNDVKTIVADDFRGNRSSATKEVALDSNGNPMFKDGKPVTKELSLWKMTGSEIALAVANTALAMRVDVHKYSSLEKLADDLNSLSPGSSKLTAGHIFQLVKKYPQLLDGQDLSSKGTTLKDNAVGIISKAYRSISVKKNFTIQDFVARLIQRQSGTASGETIASAAGQMAEARSRMKDLHAEKTPTDHCVEYIIASVPEFFEDTDKASLKLQEMVDKLIAYSTSGEINAGAKSASRANSQEIDMDALMSGNLDVNALLNKPLTELQALTMIREVISDNTGVGRTVIPQESLEGKLFSVPANKLQGLANHAIAISRPKIETNDSLDIENLG